MRTLPGTAAANYKLDAYDIVWWAQIAATGWDGSTTTLYYASREITISGHDYLDVFLPGGIVPGWAKLRQEGGVAQVASFTLQFNNLESFADLQDLYVLDNDVVQWGIVFVTGAETEDDLVTLGTGVIEEGGWDLSTWTIRAIDVSSRDFTEIPTQKVNIVQHPYAPLSEYGQVIPYTFGTWSHSPVVAAATHIAATRCLDLYARTYTPGLFSAVSAGALYEWLESDRCVARVVDKQGVDQYGDDATGADIVAFNVTSSDRVIVARPTRPGSSNTIAGYRTAINEDVSETVSVASGELLELLWTGISTRGVLTSLQARIYASGGDYTYNVKYDGVSVATASVSLSVVTIDLDAMIATYFSESWSFSQMSVEITADTATPVDVGFIFMNVSYSGEEGGDAIEVPSMRFYGTGVSSSTAIQNYVIPGTADTLAESPVEQLALVMSGKDLYDRAESELNTASFATAHAARDGSYLFSWQLMETVTWAYWSRFCFEAGLHLYPDYDGLWTVKARDKDATPQHFISPDVIALKGAQDTAPDVQISKTPTRGVINEIVFRYAWDPMTQSYLKTIVRSPKYRYTGTCAVVIDPTDGQLGTLTDASATFQTGKFPAFEDERIYVDGKYTAKIESVDSDTQLSISVVDSDYCWDVSAGTTYYGGPGLSGKLMRSWLRYKTVNPLGSSFDPIADEGGWTSYFVYDDDTAGEILDYIEDWFTQRRIVVDVATYLQALDVELGDVCYMRCPILPAGRDAILAGALDGAITDSDGTLTLSTASPYLGTVAFRTGDMISLDGELVVIAAEPTSASNDLTITRAQTNTTATAHADGTLIYLVQQKWEVTGVRYDPAKAQVRLQLTEMPWVAARVGAAMAVDVDFDSSSRDTRRLLSWGLPTTGLASQVDPHSNYSNAGA